MTKPRSAVELDQKDIQYRLVPHPNSVHTAEGAANEIGFNLGQIIKSLLVEGHRHPPVLVLVPGDKRIHFGKLGKILKDPTVFLCSPERTLEITGYPVGLVTSFGLKNSLPKLIESSILVQKQVAVSSGDWGFELVLSPQDLLDGTGAEIASFTKDLR